MLGRALGRHISRGLRARFLAFFARLCGGGFAGRIFHPLIIGLPCGIVVCAAVGRIRVGADFKLVDGVNLPERTAEWRFVRSGAGKGGAGLMGIVKEQWPS